MKLLKIFLLLKLFFVLNNANANLTPKTPKEFRDYVSLIGSAAIPFIQEVDGKISEGMLIINKPYQFRLNYYPPYPMLIVGNKNYISMYDYGMHQVSKIKSEENILNFLLLDKNNLSEDFDKQFKVEIVSNDSKYISYQIEHLATNKTSIISFDRENKKLSQLILLEGDDNITISFGTILPLKSADKDLFNIKNPDVYGPPKWLDQKGLEKKFKLK